MSSLFLILPLAVFVWLALKALRDRNGQGPTAPVVSRWTVAADHPDWVRYFVQGCESPAEVAFLRAIISSYPLLPDRGVLKGGELVLKMQVEISPFRVDFLADDWLVIEIDGAAYHSAPEQQARDKVRDQHLEANGYSVLRIPAKVVFAAPGKAIRDVREALAVGRKPRPARVRPSLSDVVGQTLTTAVKATSDLKGFMDTARAVQLAMSDARRTFDLEKVAIDGALERALTELKLEDYRQSLSPERRARVDGIRSALLQELGKFEGGGAMDVATIHIPVLSPPAVHLDPTINGAVQGAYAHLIEERSKYLAAAQERMKADPRLLQRVEANLFEIECSTSWEVLASLERQ